MATRWVNALPNPKSNNPKYPMAVHTKVNNPNREYPNPSITVGMVITPNRRGSPVPRRDQINDLDNAVVGMATTGVILRFD